MPSDADFLAQAKKRFKLALDATQKQRTLSGDSRVSSTRIPLTITASEVLTWLSMILRCNLSESVIADVGNQREFLNARIVPRESRKASRIAMRRIIGAIWRILSSIRSETARAFIGSVRKPRSVIHCRPVRKFIIPTKTRGIPTPGSSSATIRHFILSYTFGREYCVPVVIRIPTNCATIVTASSQRQPFIPAPIATMV